MLSLLYFFLRTKNEIIQRSLGDGLSLLKFSQKYCFAYTIILFCPDKQIWVLNFIKNNSYNRATRTLNNIFYNQNTIKKIVYLPKRNSTIN